MLRRGRARRGVGALCSHNAADGCIGERARAHAYGAWGRNTGGASMLNRAAHRRNGHPISARAAALFVHSARRSSLLSSLVADRDELSGVTRTLDAPPLHVLIRLQAVRGGQRETAAEFPRMAALRSPSPVCRSPRAHGPLVPADCR